MRTTTKGAIVSESFAGLLIAAIGMFGVLAFQVFRRTNELAMRMSVSA
jgi:ABC-type antimicrobial peptide transport system permease subunit